MPASPGLEADLVQADERHVAGRPHGQPGRQQLVDAGRQSQVHARQRIDGLAQRQELLPLDRGDGDDHVLDLVPLDDPPDVRQGTEHGQSGVAATRRAGRHETGDPDAGRPPVAQVRGQRRGLLVGADDDRGGQEVAARPHRVDQPSAQEAVERHQDEAEHPRRQHPHPRDHERGLEERGDDDDHRARAAGVEDARVLRTPAEQPIRVVEPEGREDHDRERRQARRERSGTAAPVA